MEDKILNRKIDDVMQSMNGIKKASPRPFLFTRLEARMLNERNIWSEISSFVARPVIAFACICFVLVLNAMVILLSGTSGNSLTQQGSELATADEYSQVSYNFYDFENTKP
ncbi:MAG: hypothetical protein ABI472_21640 [Ginsengibacter sp.]